MNVISSQSEGKAPIFRERVRFFFASNPRKWVKNLSSGKTLKFLVAIILVVVGIFTAYVNIRNAVSPLEESVEKTVLLAGQDLPADLESVELNGTSNPSKAKAEPPPTVLTDKILASKGSTTTLTVAKSSIKVTSKGNNLLVLVNKTIRLTETYAPADLVNLDSSIQGSPGMQLRKAAAGELLKLFDDSKKKGYKLNVNSSYRSYQTQVNTYNYWVSQVGAVEADRFSARPGHSQHQLGTTADITSDTVDYKLVAAFGNTTEGKWLAQNAYKYGFVLAYPSGYEQVTGYTYEPWHFRYIGATNAINMKNSGMILELYLQKYGVW